MSDPVKEYLSKIGSKGGKKSSSNMTPEQRKERARLAGKAPKKPRTITSLNP